MDRLEKKKNSLKNMKQYSNVSEEELLKIAQVKLDEEEIIDSLSFCLDSEKPLAKRLLENYLEEASFENYSERDTLIQLIGLEILAERIRQYLKTEGEKANPGIPLQMVEQLTNLSKQILELKEKLGLTRKENTNTLGEWNKLKEKALNYYKENQGCNVVKCPYCQKLFMILKNVKDYTAGKIPWFKKTLLYNHKLFELYEQNRISKEEMCVIFGVSADYIDLIFDNEYKNNKQI
jgi:hypothetical protein